MNAPTWGIVGHEWALGALSASIARDNVPHALLFVGPPGVGKRTLAWAFVRALECTHPDSAARPCGECTACRRLADGNYPDVRVIETERSGGKERRDISIDQIRSLQHQLSLKPYEGRWIIGLVIDAQEMSDAAANCLLKTLEEPQRQAVLILTAPDTNALLPTIVSRCQVFSLRPLPTAAASAALQEQFAAPADKAQLLGRLSGGRLGWAIQAAADDAILAGRNERLDMLRDLAGASRVQRLERSAALSETYSRGQDGRAAIYGILDLWASWWRDAMLLGQGCPKLVVNLDRLEELRSVAKAYPAEAVAGFLEAILATREQLEANVNPRLALDALMLALPQKASSRRRQS